MGIIHPMKNCCERFVFSFLKTNALKCTENEIQPSELTFTLSYLTSRVFPAVGQYFHHWKVLAKVRRLIYFAALTALYNKQ